MSAEGRISLLGKGLEGRMLKMVRFGGAVTAEFVRIASTSEIPHVRDEEVGGCRSSSVFGHVGRVLPYRQCLR